MTNADLKMVLKDRFMSNMHRHPDWAWEDVAVLLGDRDKLRSLGAMEETGGEPDVVQLPGYEGRLVFADCSAESPTGRRSLCYDREALNARKQNKPSGAALEMAGKMGIELLSEALYRELQTSGKFDLKTSSWIKTPAQIRKLGGALFCDRRYDTVFTYHNGAESYYAARGFRGMLVI